LDITTIVKDSPKTNMEILYAFVKYVKGVDAEGTCARYSFSTGLEKQLWGSIKTEAR